jgi:hypothetical protein
MLLAPIALAYTLIGVAVVVSGLTSEHHRTGLILSGALLIATGAVLVAASITTSN